MRVLLIMKYCTRCQTDRDEAEFSKTKRTKDGLQSECKACRANRHQEKKQHNLQRIYGRRKRIAEWFHELKSKLRCERCGENHPACLQFHHKDVSQKDIEISTAAHAGWSLASIQEEIAKCEVLCANCHFKEHAALSSSS